MKAIKVFALCVAMFAGSASAQIGCKVSFGSSSTMKDLYGGKVSVIQGTVNCINFGPAEAISGSLIDYSLPTVNTVTAQDASAILTKTYNNQPGQRWGRDITTGIGALGVLEASKTLALGAGPLGLAVAGGVAAVQYVVPAFTANEPPLNLTNQCDAVQGVTLDVGQNLTCRIYVRKPGKKDPQLPAALAFTIATGALSPAPPPPPPPVQLKPPVSQFPGTGMLAPQQQGLSSLDKVSDAGMSMDKHSVKHRLKEIMAARRAAETAMATAT